MSQISITGASTGTATFTIESPATSTNRTLTLPDNTGTIITQNSTPAFASTIGVGGATAAASGAGITFPATASASSDANTLDDYEEGTWTPAGNTGFPGGGIDVAIGTYTKIGNVVHAFALMTAKNDGTTIQIGGLPFATSYYEAVSISHETLTVRYERMLSGESTIKCVFSATQTAAFQEIFIQATYRV